MTRCLGLGHPYRNCHVRIERDADNREGCPMKGRAERLSFSSQNGRERKQMSPRAIDIKTKEAAGIAGIARTPTRVEEMVTRRSLAVLPRRNSWGRGQKAMAIPGSVKTRPRFVPVTDRFPKVLGGTNASEIPWNVIRFVAARNTELYVLPQVIRQYWMVFLNSTQCSIDCV